MTPRAQILWPVLRLRWALVALGLLVGNALWLTGVVHLDLRASGTQIPWQRPLVWELTSALVVWLLLPMVQMLALNAPWTRATWRKSLAWHLGGILVFWGVHVAGMWLSRVVIYDAMGWGSYDYGRMIFRVPMEGLKDALALGALSALFQYVEARKVRQSRDLAAAQMESDLREARLQALSAQLDPHFLFNALNTLSSVMYEDLDKADRLLASLGQMLRDGLQAEGIVWTVGRELEHLRHYLSIVGARFGDRLSVSVEVPPELEAVEVPRFSLQRLVENALKHNAETVNGPLHVRVTGGRAGSDVWLCVSDDGVGFAPGVPKGVGLEILRHCLDLLHQGRAEMTHGNGPSGGAWVRILLPGGCGHD